jgi:hypothetical protein
MSGRNPWKIALALMFAFTAAATHAGPPPPPLVPGEEFRYAVSWAIVPGAGQIVVRAAPGPAGQLKITTETSTRRFARMLLTFDATSESLYDLKTGRLLSMHDWSNMRGKHVEHLVTFDYPARKANYVEVGSTTPRILDVPDGNPADLIIALLSTRNWDIKPGDARDALVLFNDDFYELTIHALRYEEVTTVLGSFRTLVLEPRMEKTPPKGMFAKGSTVQVWISQDERKLPVKFEVEFKIGTGTATLEHYDPPSPGAGAAAATAESSATGSGAAPAAPVTSARAGSSATASTAAKSPAPTTAGAAAKPAPAGASAR